MILFDDAIGLFDSPTGLFDFYDIINANLSLNSIESQSQTGEIVLNFDFEVQINGQNVESIAQNITALGNSIVVIDGLQLQSELNSIGIEANSNAYVVLNSLKLSSQYSNVNVNIQQSASVLLDGQSLRSSIQQVSANVISENTFVGGGSEVYNDIAQDGHIRIIGQSSKSYHGRILPLGEIVNDAVATINPVFALTDSQISGVRGVLGISDEDLLLLLVA